MAEQAWSSYTDYLINVIDTKLKRKYDITVRDLFTDPSRFAGKQGISNTIGSMKADADGIIDALAATRSSDKDAFNASLPKLDAISKKIAAIVTVQAKQSGIPIISPEAFNRNEADDIAIAVSNADADVQAVVQKLVPASLFIVDMSVSYNNYLIGSWLFAGSRNYLLNIYMEQNDFVQFQSSKDEIDAMFAYASSTINGLNA